MFASVKERESEREREMEIVFDWRKMRREKQKEAKDVRENQKMTEKKMCLNQQTLHLCNWSLVWLTINMLNVAACSKRLKTSQLPFAIL